MNWKITDGQILYEYIYEFLEWCDDCTTICNIPITTMNAVCKNADGKCSNFFTIT